MHEVEKKKMLHTQFVMDANAATGTSGSHLWKVVFLVAAAANTFSNVAENAFDGGDSMVLVKIWVQTSKTTFWIAGSQSAKTERGFLSMECHGRRSTAQRRNLRVLFNGEDDEEEDEDDAFFSVFVFK